MRCNPPAKSQPLDRSQQSLLRTRTSPGTAYHPIHRGRNPAPYRKLEWLSGSAPALQGLERRRTRPRLGGAFQASKHYLLAHLLYNPNPQPAHQFCSNLQSADPMPKGGRHTRPQFSSSASIMAVAGYVPSITRPYIRH